MDFYSEKDSGGETPQSVGGYERTAGTTGTNSTARPQRRSDAMGRVFYQELERMVRELGFNAIEISDYRFGGSVRGLYVHIMRDFRRDFGMDESDPEKFRQYVSNKLTSMRLDMKLHSAQEGGH